MITVFNAATDPYFNLASEEYLLENAVEDVFMLWRNAPSVIIGKNQNAWAEINVDFTEKNNICVARRLTGGGAVFHDLGNVNFSFVTGAKEDTRLNFAAFTEPIIKALEKMGLKASLDGRNDIVADGYKISGNAQCVFRRKNGDSMLLHHGTLLFGADMSKLAGALNVSEDKIRSKGIKSVKSRVANIKDIPGYSGPDNVEDFMDLLFSCLSDTPPVEFSEEETAKIKKLRDEKFSRWEWIFGASPDHEVSREKRFSYGSVKIMLKTKNAVIDGISVSGDFFGTEDVSVLEEKLLGCNFKKEDVMSALTEEPNLCGRVVMGSCAEDILSVLFEQ